MTRDDLIERFAGFPPRLAGVAVATEGRSIPAGEWGPHEVVRHLIAVESEVWQSRLAQLATEDGPTWPWTEPGPATGFDGATLTAILDAFARVRAHTAATIAALDDAGWARTGVHATYGVLDVAGLLGQAIDHDQEHLTALS